MATAVHDIHVSDGHSITRLTSILIDGDIITHSNNLTKITTRVDAAGRILIPGLMDCHAHDAVHSSDCEDLGTFASWAVTTINHMACYNYTEYQWLQQAGSAGLLTFMTAGLPVGGPENDHARNFNATPDQ
jgi:hypothetical protein